MKLRNIKLIVFIGLVISLIFILPTSKVEAKSKKNISKAKISSISAKAYTGKAIKPAITVKYKGKKLKLNRDYKVSYTRNKNIGTAKVKIKGIKKYKGTKTKTFKIKVTNTTNVKISGKTSDSISLKWSGTSKNITGYKIYMATLRNGKYNLIKTINGKATTYTVAGLENYKRYYFKVRAYKKIGSKTYYGNYSSMVNEKTLASDKAFTSYLVRNPEKEQIVAEEVNRLMAQNEYNQKYNQEYGGTCGTCRAVRDDEEAEMIKSHHIFGSYNPRTIEILGMTETFGTLVITVYDVYTYDSAGKEVNLSDCLIYKYEIDE